MWRRTARLAVSAACRAAQSSSLSSTGPSQCLLAVYKSSGINPAGFMHGVRCEASCRQSGLGIRPFSSAPVDDMDERVDTINELFVVSVPWGWGRAAGPSAHAHAPTHWNAAHPRQTLHAPTRRRRATRSSMLVRTRIPPTSTSRWRRHARLWTRWAAAYKLAVGGVT